MKFPFTDPNELYNLIWDVQNDRHFPAQFFSEDIQLPICECADGWKVSIQAGSPYYSIPRQANAGVYAGFELGYPTEAEPLLMDYAEDAENPTSTVYPFTPTEVIKEVLSKHGGVIGISKTW